MTGSSLLVCGTHSDAGKSLVTAGLCRWLSDQGVSVAPFKAQNMALNSVVTRGGAEIGRAQATQAAAARVPAEAAMNPVLIKPSGERRSQVVVMGLPYATADARSYQELKPELAPVVAQALADLRERFEVVICEGAGSPAEINLRANDLANMGLAKAARLPVLLVADIDRGGVFASLLGTLALLDAEDQALVAGFVINKFRGDLSVLRPGLDDIEKRTGRPVLGVLPYAEGLWLDAEDSLALEAQAPERPAVADTLDVAVIRLRWMSNFTDVDALRSEPGVRVRYTRSPADVERADLVVVPGTKATVEDLERLRADGLDVAVHRRAGEGAPILGICGGYQMLGTAIDDDVESGRGRVDGLGLLPITTRFASEKLLRNRRGHCDWLSAGASGYEIRHGRVERDGGEPLIAADDGEPEGAWHAAVLGLSWHGVLEHDDFRRRLLGWVAETRGRDFNASAESFETHRERQLARVGELVGEHMDTAVVMDLLSNGAPGDLPVVTTEVAPCFA
jgi:adenosylcobyric acid synthase